VKVRVAQQGRRREGLAIHPDPSGDVVASGGAVADERLTTPPKGNLVQQNRVRTQWRENLQHALERIRQAVPAC
jgi:hypothetical protein